MRKLLACVLTFCVVVGIFFFLHKKEPEPVPEWNPSPQPNRKLTLDEALLLIQKEELVKNLNYLTSNELEGRMSGMKGNGIAASYIENLFQSYGLQTVKQSFAVQRMNEFKEKSSGKTENIIAVLSGSSETIVIGAHMDHIGYGPSMSRSPSRREIHPGADDNASGTTALLGIAKVFGSLKQNKRTLVFIAFSGEEMGLLGSRYYVNNPLYPLPIFMLNMDMVGRFNGSSIDCGGAGNSNLVKEAINKIKGRYPFRPNITAGSGGGSDHVPFYQKGIPITFLHTGMHGDYHTPGDVASKINFDGLLLVTRFASHLIWEIDQRDSRPVLEGIFRDPGVFRDHDI